MSWWSDRVDSFGSAIKNGYSAYSEFLYKNWMPYRAVSPLLGYDQERNAIQSNQRQIDYDEYLKQGNMRAYNDWQKNVGSQGRTIKYPELSYPGAIYRADTGVARSSYSNDSAYANIYRSGFYGTAGLYGITGKLSRSL